jgi:hypothetical protein
MFLVTVRYNYHLYNNRTLDKRFRKIHNVGGNYMLVRTAHHKTSLVVEDLDCTNSPCHHSNRDQLAHYTNVNHPSAAILKAGPWSWYSSLTGRSAYRISTQSTIIPSGKVCTNVTTIPVRTFASTVAVKTMRRSP